MASNRSQALPPNMFATSMRGSQEKFGDSGPSMPLDPSHFDNDTTYSELYELRRTTHQEFSSELRTLSYEPLQLNTIGELLFDPSRLPSRAETVNGLLARLPTVDITGIPESERSCLICLERYDASTPQPVRKKPSRRSPPFDLGVIMWLEKNVLRIGLGEEN